jgi:type I restriction enzyme R subunit
MTTAVDALLAGGAPNQKVINANLDPAVERFAGLDDDDQVVLRDTLVAYVRAYGFLAQVMPWTDPELEQLYLYGRMLQTKLPAAPGEPVPHLSEAVVLTHLRTVVTAEEVDAGLQVGDETPGQAFTGAGTGSQNDPPHERLSVLIATLNDKFGMNLTDADKVWFEQQKQAIKDSYEARVVALHKRPRPVPDLPREVRPGRHHRTQRLRCGGTQSGARTLSR